MYKKEVFCLPARVRVRVAWPRCGAADVKTVVGCWAIFSRGLNVVGPVYQPLPLFWTQNSKLAFFALLELIPIQLLFALLPIRRLLQWSITHYQTPNVDSWESPLNLSLPLLKTANIAPNMTDFVMAESLISLVRLMKYGSKFQA